jgi:hypothetical protein
MSKTVGQYVGHPEDNRSFAEDKCWVLPKHLIGIEIELERWVKPPFRTSNPWWHSGEDDSLRSVDGYPSYELKLNTPLCGADLTAALNSLEKEFNKHNPLPIHTERTSTHIHVDVRGFKQHEFIRLVALGTVYERALIKYCHPSRHNNNFSMPFYLAEGGVFSRLSPKLFDSKDSYLQVTTPDLRYNAINLAAVKKFGSLEFRMLEGITDIQKLRNWVNILMCIVKEARGNIPIGKLPSYYSQHGFMESATDTFGQYLKEIYYDDFQKDMITGIRQAQDIIHRLSLINAVEELPSKVGKHPEVLIKAHKEVGVPIKAIKQKARIKASLSAQLADLGEAEMSPELVAAQVIPHDPEEDIDEDFDDEDDGDTGEEN